MLGDFEKIQQLGGYHSSLMISFFLGIDGIKERLKVNVKEGIEAASIPSRISGFGSNERSPPIPRGFCAILWKVMEDTVLRILLIASIASIIIEMIVEEEKSLAWIDGTGIFIAVVIVSMVSTANDYSKERQFLKLNEQAESEKKVYLYIYKM